MTSLLFKVELEPDTFNRGGIFSFQAYALMNEREQAIKWLDVTADDGFPCYPLFEKDANLDNLRQVPGEAEREQWEHYKTIL